MCRFRAPEASFAYCPFGQRHTNCTETSQQNTRYLYTFDYIRSSEGSPIVILAAAGYRPLCVIQGFATGGLGPTNR